MSEEILKALMQLFALIAKQDGGVEENEKHFVRTFLTTQLSDDKVREYYALFEKHSGLEEDDQDVTQGEKTKLTSVIDSVRILGICRKINKTLTQNQKAVVLVRLYELINTERKFTRQRMEIIATVADVFKIGKEENHGIEEFVTKTDPFGLTDPHILLISDMHLLTGKCRHIHAEKLDGCICILNIPSVDLYFLKYAGSEDLFLNGLPVSNYRIYLFASGSTLKLPKGKPVYYSDVSSAFIQEKTDIRLSFDVKDLQYAFPSGHRGIRNISFSESHGGLIGIMGSSGAGKTTLLHILSGITKPSTGSVQINGLDLYKEPGKLSGVIGLIPQDDLLIEELTVFQNLYFNARLCFRDKPKEEITAMVKATLSRLDLTEIMDYRVGSVLNKMISGGQRKRLNIALELIREPSILFVDEPTSGLSSRDSENVMDLLLQLSLKGKLIFVVIHQPSSEIYKLFDKIILLDTGGYMIYYGNPVEAVMYFKRLDAQINSEIGECPVCGNVNPELPFNIIDAKVVDEFGRYTEKRKVDPSRWEQLFRENYSLEHTPPVTEPPPRNLTIPGWFRQTGIFTRRDILSKISNRQYLLLTLLEAPVLGFILSYIIRYIADPSSDVYIFRENENIPIYIFMSLIVALFLGLIVSAEEIFRDSKILKRESFLNLSRSAYLISKISILFLISAIQALLFVVTGNSILAIQGMYPVYWFAFFSTAACANMIGLNISASFNSAITIYIVIPLLIIPMMVLSGAMFPFDKLNRTVGSVNKVPWIAEVMVTKWSYEALMVSQFKNNEYEKQFYDLRKAESTADFKQVYVLPELFSRFEKIRDEYTLKGTITETTEDLVLLKNEISREMILVPDIQYLHPERLKPGKISKEDLSLITVYLDELNEYYRKQFTRANTGKEMLIRYFTEKDPGLYNAVKDACYNESVAEHVRKVFEKRKMVVYRNQLIQQIDPVYHDPFPDSWIGFRSHFFAPRKYFMGRYFDTFWFNMGFIWFLLIIFYITLYLNALHRTIRFFEKFKYR